MTKNEFLSILKSEKGAAHLDLNTFADIFALGHLHNADAWAAIRLEARKHGRTAELSANGQEVVFRRIG